MKIYVASSWRNTIQPTVVEALRAVGHEVYDFKNPDGKTGFSWNQISNPEHTAGRVDGDWQKWTPAEFREALNHPLAQAGFRSDMDALKACDACILVMSSGRSAHLELGWAAGAGKHTAVLMLEPAEPELMYAMCNTVCTSIDEVIAWTALAATETEVQPPPICTGSGTVPTDYRLVGAGTMVLGLCGICGQAGIPLIGGSHLVVHPYSPRPAPAPSREPRPPCGGWHCWQTPDRTAWVHSRSSGNTCSFNATDRPPDVQPDPAAPPPASPAPECECPECGATLTAFDAEMARRKYAFRPGLTNNVDGWSPPVSTRCRACGGTGSAGGAAP